MDTMTDTLTPAEWHHRLAIRWIARRHGDAFINISPAQVARTQRRYSIGDLERRLHVTHYTVAHHGSLALLTPRTPAARVNLADGLSDEAQWFGAGVAVEPRYLADLVGRLQADGWVVA